MWVGVCVFVAFEVTLPRLEKRPAGNPPMGSPYSDTSAELHRRKSRPKSSAILENPPGSCQFSAEPRVQDVRFPATSDEFWERSPLMQKMMADQMNPISNPDVQPGRAKFANAARHCSKMDG